MLNDRINGLEPQTDKPSVPWVIDREFNHKFGFLKEVCTCASTYKSDRHPGASVCVAGLAISGCNKKTLPLRYALTGQFWSYKM